MVKMEENKKNEMRDLSPDEMGKINGGDSNVGSVMDIFKKKKEPEWKPPTCIRCGSTDVELTNNGTGAYCAKCWVEWTLEYYHQSPDVKP